MEHNRCRHLPKLTSGQWSPLATRPYEALVPRIRRLRRLLRVRDPRTISAATMHLRPETQHELRLEADQAVVIPVEIHHLQATDEVTTEAVQSQTRGCVLPGTITTEK